MAKCRQDIVRQQCLVASFQMVSLSHWTCWPHESPEWISPCKPALTVNKEESLWFGEGGGWGWGGGMMSHMGRSCLYTLIAHCVIRLFPYKSNKITRIPFKLILCPQKTPKTMKTYFHPFFYFKMTRLLQRILASAGRARGCLFYFEHVPFECHLKAQRERGCCIECSATVASAATDFIQIQREKKPTFPLFVYLCDRSCLKGPQEDHKVWRVSKAATVMQSQQKQQQHTVALEQWAKV